MSNTATLHPLISCLQQAKKYLHTNNRWAPINEPQKKLVGDQGYYNKFVHDLSLLKDVFSTMTTEDYKELIQFFKDHGFDFNIEPFEKDEFGVGVVMRVLVEWLTKHKKITMNVDGKDYDGVSAKQNCEIYESAHHNHPIALLYTKSDEHVYLTVADKDYNDCDVFALADRVDCISKVMGRDYNYKGVEFPMVDLDQKVDISWLQGLYIKTNAAPGIITEAQQKTKFQMNHFGAKVESAAIMRITRSICIPQPKVIINKPFLIWITKDLLEKPVFVGYISQENWKNPREVS